MTARRSTHERRSVLHRSVIPSPSQKDSTHLHHSLHHLANLSGFDVGSQGASTQQRKSCVHRPPASADRDPPWITSGAAAFPKEVIANQRCQICQQRPRHPSSSYQIVSKSLRDTRRDLRELRCVQCVICGAVSCVDVTSSLRPNIRRAEHSYNQQIPLGQQCARPHSLF